MTTTIAALNRRLAKALKWRKSRISSALWRTQEGENVHVFLFSPAESTDDLRRYVYPEIVRRKRWSAFMQALDAAWTNAADSMETEGTFNRFLLTADPAVLAEAACVVLEGA